MPLPEKSLIKMIWRAVGSGGRRGLVKGIGDDGAILMAFPDDEILVTTDFSLEGIHFRREWHPPESVGHRCLARGLSDIAAMGGEPLACFLSLALPPNLPQSWVSAFTRGFLRLAKRFKVPLAGGDTAQSPAGVLADIVVLGRVPKGTALLRSGAKPGDSIYVTGELGSSAAVLHKLRSGGSRSPARRLEPAHFFPEPRIEVGQFLRGKRLASAAIDISDGLSTDLAHICEESHVGAVINASAIPHAANVSLEQALQGGEDYELLFTAPAKLKSPSHIAGMPVTRIGEIVRGSRMYLVQTNGKRKPLKARGWEHFTR